MNIAASGSALRKGRHRHLIFAVVGMLCCLAAAGLGRADGLTTFEEYAAMNPGQRAKVLARATGIIYGQALRQGDEQRGQCILRGFLNGPDEVVQLAHARLRGFLEAGIENHDEESRVEYAIAHHLKETCPPAVDTTSP